MTVGEIKEKDREKVVKEFHFDNFIHQGGTEGTEVESLMLQSRETPDWSINSIPSGNNSSRSKWFGHGI
jgi:hypothetical protein